VKFTDPGGAIDVEVDVSSPGMVTTRVTDTGRGIAREHLSTIFDRFRQIDSSSTRAQGGLGLGLAIARHLVEAHGGTIAAESEGPARGATFRVTLPAAAPAVVVFPDTRSDGKQARTLRGVRVLVVDDQEDARDLVADALTALGAKVDVAASASEGLERLREEPPHVLVSDIGMPVEDGYALMRRVRSLPAQLGGDVPAIALTAYARPEDVAAAHEAGFQLHIAKPVRLEQLVEAILSCVRPV
jgi:CheY-like chemotaxis protein